MCPKCGGKSGNGCFNILILIYFFKYETISTFAPTFWMHIISELGGVKIGISFSLFPSFLQKAVLRKGLE